MTGRNGGTELERVLLDAGGVAAPRERHAQIRQELDAALAHGARELRERRSGYERPVELGLAAGPGALHAVVPVALALRADPAAAPERGWLLVAAAVAGLVEAAGLAAPAGPEDRRLDAGAHGAFLTLTLPAPEPDAELAALAVEERLARIDRLRARAHALPPGLVAPDDPRRPTSPALATAEALARLGGDPADPDSLDAYEDALVALLPATAAPVSAHDDPDPSRRAARRILRRLDGMGKWGGYHTAFDHLSRGFAGNDRALAGRVGEALLAAELLRQKPSVGQRHVFLNPRKAGEIRALIEDGTVPPNLRLP